MTDKNSVRTAWQRAQADMPTAPQGGKAAQKLRNLQIYRKATTIFATPEKLLHQARINCLVDGKNLVMPAPSLREGFYLLQPHTIPFKDLQFAVTFKGLSQLGHLLKNHDIGTLSVELLLSGSVVVDREGGRIGDGNGFFDLSNALFQELGGLQQEWSALTFVAEEQISPEPLPQDIWDIRMAAAITPNTVHTFDRTGQIPQIFWDKLSSDRIRKVTPLWQLQREKPDGTRQ